MSFSTMLLIHASDYLHYLSKTVHQHIAFTTQSSFCAVRHPHFVSPGSQSTVLV